MKARKADERYDAKMAYDKNLSGKARLHYLENDIADKGMSMKAPMDMKSAMEMKAPMNMGHEAPSMKAPMNKAGRKAGKEAMKKAGKAAMKKGALAAGAMVPGIGAAAAGAGAAAGKGKKRRNPIDMKAPMRKESAKQERKNLMQDNPVVKDASGKRKFVDKPETGKKKKKMTAEDFRKLGMKGAGERPKDPRRYGKGLKKA